MSTNLSKQKRETLLNHIEEIRTFLNKSLNDENARNLAGYLNELTSEIKGQKYGLVFEEHKEAIDEKLESNLPVLTEEKELFVGNGGEMNFLIEGDNLASLQLLEKTHKGKIDVIYIDPPYNTGNKDFIYDDDFISEDDLYRHSKWCSFIKKRLEISRNLLCENGVIFISIDDNEFADLKIICDEVFSSSCFIANTVWQNSIQPKGYLGSISMQHNYTLIYSKSTNWKIGSLKRTAEHNKAYKNPDNDPRGLWRSGDVRNALYRPNLIYDIITPSGKKISPPSQNGWRWSKETVEEKIKTGEIIFNKDETGIIRKIYLDSVGGRAPESIWFGEDVGTTRNATTELKEIFSGTSPFDTPKPTNLIKRILELSTNKNSIILDFFAGSGTTGHAVLKLNAEDGGKRKFILCTNNENSICRDITYQRLKTVITGKRKDGSVYSDGLAGSLKYFKVDFVEITEKEYYEYADKLLLHVRELVELENAVNFKGNDKIAIVLTEEELEEFCKPLASTPLSNRSEIEVSERIRTVYLGHDVLLSKGQKELFKKSGITIKIIPQYYYPELNG